MKNVYKKIKKGLLFFIITFLLLGFFSTSSMVNYHAGTVFFGKYTSLYNIEVAEFLFNRSVNPLYGKPYSGSHYQLSRIYFIQGNFGKSILYANKELELYPNNCRTYYIRGLVYAYADDVDKAIEDFKMFNYSCVKNSWAGHNDLAWLYFRKGDMENMKKTIEEVADRYKHNPWVLNTYGLALLNTQEYAKALEVLERAEYASQLIDSDYWGGAYPGNNPAVYQKGLTTMRETIKNNIAIAKEALEKK